MVQQSRDQAADSRRTQESRWRSEPVVGAARRIL